MQYATLDDISLNTQLNMKTMVRIDASKSHTCKKI